MVSNFLKYFEKILCTLEIVFIDLKSPVLVSTWMGDRLGTPGAVGV